MQVLFRQLCTLKHQNEVDQISGLTVVACGFPNWSSWSASQLSHTLGPPGYKPRTICHVTIFSKSWSCSQVYFVYIIKFFLLWSHSAMQVQVRIKLKPLTYFLLAKILNTLLSRQFFLFFLILKVFVFWPLRCVI